MKQWLYRIQVIRPGWHTDGPTPEEEEILGEHVDYLVRLHSEGVLILAGPTLNEDATRFGLVVFKAASEEAARAIMQNDPTVKKGVMSAELFPFNVALLGK